MNINTNIKKTISIALCLSMTTVAMSGQVIPTTVGAEEEFTIINPVENALKGAGYVDVDWSDVTGVTQYKLYVDGELKATTTESKAEFYTTEVKMYTAYVTAVKEDGSTVSTDTVSFGVSKKGLAGNDVMARYLDPKAMQVSWYYNWGTSAFTHSTFEEIEFVPMIWGTGNDGMISTIAERGDKYLLAYNEPDMGSSGGGSNTSVEVVLQHWPNFLGYDFHLGGPAPAFSPSWDNGTWAQEFYNSIDLDDIDFMPFHCYYGQYGGEAAAKTFLEDVVDKNYETYHKPIWITEFAPSGWGYSNEYGRQQCYDFMRAVIKGLDERSYVERYSWFSFDTTDESNGAAALWTNSTGELTELGELYVSLGNPEGYSLSDDSDKEPDPYSIAVSEKKELLPDYVSIGEDSYEDYTKTSGVSISASSELGNNNAEAAIDESIGTRWESTQGHDPEYLTIDFGQIRNIKQVDIIWEAAQARNYTVQVSDNGTDFTDVALYKNGVSVGYRYDSIVFNEMVSGRYIRILGTARNLTYGYSIYDMAVYGSEKKEEKIPVQVLGFQYNTDLNGFRIVYSVEGEVDGLSTVEIGNIFAYDKDNNLTLEDLTIDSSNNNVRQYTATSNGLSPTKYSQSSTADDYIMTFIKNGTTEEAYSRKYIVRPYIKLSDGTVVYGDAKSFSIYDIADELYTTKSMFTSEKHNYLYTNILKVVNPDYETIAY